MRQPVGKARGSTDHTFGINRSYYQLMTMTTHKVTGDEGYGYLTGQVVYADGQGRDEYALVGELPGVWLGSGAAVLGLTGQVDPEAMQTLWMQAATGRRNRQQAVAGFDLTFSPVKSVSVLWGIGPDDLRHGIETAHREAVAETLAFIESKAAFTRTGHNGTVLERTQGLAVAAFEHRTSRAGDPDLHTHAAVVNRVLGLDGKPRTLDSRSIYVTGVVASETYNARLEDRLVRGLGLAFAEVPRAGLRGVREVVGVPEDLLRLFSSRRAAVEARQAELAAAYLEKHGMVPGRTVGKAAALYQQATLETRTAKGPALSLRDRVARWQRQAGGSAAVERVLAAVRAAVHALDPRTLRQVAEAVRERVSRDRVKPLARHVRAEAERQLRAHPAAAGEQRNAAVDAVQETVMEMEQGKVGKGMAVDRELRRVGQDLPVVEPAAEPGRLEVLAARGRELRGASRAHQALNAAADFYREQAGTEYAAWTGKYLESRGLPADLAGYAPGRSVLTDHLRERGFTGKEILATGMARRTDRGMVFDTFRDRLVLPIKDAQGQVLSFVGRKHPGDDLDYMPRYMNGPETPAYDKRKALYGLNPESAEKLQQGAELVIVEGPLDAEAVNVSRETSVAVALCGTNLTAEHLQALNAVAPLSGRDVIVAFDNDAAGRQAAEAAYPLLQQAGVEMPLTYTPVEGTKDFSELLQTQGAVAVSDCIALDRPLAELVIENIKERYPYTPGSGFAGNDPVEPRIGAMIEASRVIATMPLRDQPAMELQVAKDLKLDTYAVQDKVTQHRVQAATPGPVAGAGSLAGYVQQNQVPVVQLGADRGYSR